MIRCSRRSSLASVALLAGTLPFQGAFPGPEPEFLARAAGWLTLAALGLVAFQGGFRLARWIGLESGADRVAASVLLGVLHLVLPSLVLGSIGVLTPLGLAAGQVLVGLCVALLTPEAASAFARREPQEPSAGSHTLAGPPRHAAAGPTAEHHLVPGIPTPSSAEAPHSSIWPPPFRRTPVLDGVWWGWRRLCQTLLFVLAVLAAVTLLQNAMDPPISYDALVYHLAFPVHWLRTGSLDSPRLMFGGTDKSFYPVHTELWFAALLAPLHGSDLAAKFGELPFALVALAALCCICRRLGFGDAGRDVLFLLGLSSAWAVIETPTRVGNDLALAAGELCFVAWALLPAGQRRARVLLCGLALGWAVGVKYVGVVHAPALLGLFCWCVALDARGARGFVRGAADLAAVLVLATAVGGWAYFRNAVCAGGPLYPSRIQVLGVALGPGQDPAARAHEHWSQPGHGAFDGLLAAPQDTGEHFPFVTIPLLLVAVLGLARRGRANARLLAVLFAATGIWALVAGFVPNRQDSRFLIAALLLAPLGAAWLSERKPLGLAVQGLALASAGLACARLAPEVVGRPDAAVLVLGLALLLGWRLASTPRRRAHLGLACVMGGLLTLPLIEPRYLAERYDRWARQLPHAGPGWRDLARIAGDGQTIVSVGRNRAYPLMGRRLSNPVLQLPVDRPSDGQEAYGWGSRDTRSRGNVGPQSPELFRENVLRSGASFVFVEPRQGRGYTAELSWLAARPDLFVKLRSGNRLARIFFVNRRDSRMH